jgi:predicted outer membrane protein
MKRLFVWTTAVGAALLVALTLAAQERRAEQDKNKQNTTQNPAAQTGRDQGVRGRTQSDSQLATWLATDNEGEIELSKFATQRAKNDEVKKFAQHMVDEHTEFLKKLQRMGALASTGSGSAPGKTATRLDDTSKRQPETAQTRPGDDTTVRRGYLDPDGRIDLARIKQEIGQQCVQTFKKELSEKSSDEFDQCYMGLQIGAHLGMSDTLMVMKTYASPELRELIMEGEKATKKHLDEAKDIVKRLDGQSAKKDSQGK